MISIHLMLRFNGTTDKQTGRARYFNTSYVTVQPRGNEAVSDQEVDFNTSYVTVQHCRACPKGGTSCISIHLMLRFNL